MRPCPLLVGSRNLKAARDAARLLADASAVELDAPALRARSGSARLNCPHCLSATNAHADAMARPAPAAGGHLRQSPSIW